jgi:hypothetical protein
VKVRKFFSSRWEFEILRDQEPAFRKLRSSTHPPFAVGKGDVRLDLKSMHRFFVALYVDGEQLCLQLDSLVVDLFNPRVNVTCTSRFHAVRRFEVIRDGATIFRADYFWVDAFADPLNGTGDFLKVCSEIAWSLDLKLNFFHVCRARSRGESMLDPNTKAEVERAIEADLHRGGHFS